MQEVTIEQILGAGGLLLMSKSSHPVSFLDLHNPVAQPEVSEILFYAVLKTSIYYIHATTALNLRQPWILWSHCWTWTLAHSSAPVTTTSVAMSQPLGSLRYSPKRASIKGALPVLPSSQKQHSPLGLSLRDYMSWLHFSCLMRGRKQFGLALGPLGGGVRGAKIHPSGCCFFQLTICNIPINLPSARQDNHLKS